MSLRLPLSPVLLLFLFLLHGMVACADLQDNTALNSLPFYDQNQSVADSGTEPQGALTGKEIIIQSNNRFSTDLFKAISKEPDNADQNLFFSPISIFSALSLTYEGARNDTADEIASVCYLPKNDSVRRGGVRELDEEINTVNASYLLRTGNALWAEKTYPFLPAYTTLAEQWYGAEVSNLDIMNNADESARKINAWAGERTEGKIPDLIDSLSPDTRLVLTSAIYFKGTWADQFDEKQTSDEQFNTSPTQSVPARMMSKTAKYNYLETSDLQVLELPYSKGDGRQLSMLVILPKNNNMTAAEQTLNPRELADIKNNRTKKEVEIHIPRFTCNKKYDLGSTLSVLGMPDAFSEKADLSGMDGSRDLYISDVIHSSCIEVNEEGTEAAAATSVEAAVLSIKMPAPVFRADHPFIFLIQDNESGTILFIGRITNPSGSEK